MKIQSQTLGNIDIRPHQLFHFPYGLYAFETLRSFALLDSESPPFYWLQSLEAPELAFLALTPQLWLPNYNIELVSLDDLLSIGISNPNTALDLPLFSIITINEHNSADSTANMQSPIILNRARNLGRQIILKDESWSVRHNLRLLCCAEEIPNRAHCHQAG